MPGFASIPLFGKLFQSRSVSKSSSELLVMVTPELVRPIPQGIKPPDVHATEPFLKDAPTAAPQQPGAAVTGPSQLLLKRDTVPIEELRASPQAAGAASVGEITAPAPSVGAAVLPPPNPDK